MAVTGSLGAAGAPRTVRAPLRGPGTRGMLTGDCCRAGRRRSVLTGGLGQLVPVHGGDHQQFRANPHRGRRGQRVDVIDLLPRDRRSREDRGGEERVIDKRDPAGVDDPLAAAPHARGRYAALNWLAKVPAHSKDIR